MSRIDELINELCIQGVEFKSLGELCSIQTGNQLNKEKLNDVYGIRWRDIPYLNFGSAVDQ